MRKDKHGQASKSARRKLFRDPKLPYLRTVLLGQCHSIEVVQNAYEERGIRVTREALEMISSIEPSKEISLIQLTFVTVQSLEFTRGVANRDDVYKAGITRRKFTLIPAEAAIFLRLCYTEQPVGEWVYVAMSPIKGVDGKLRIFSLGRNEEGLILATSDGRDKANWHMSRIVAFVIY